MVDEAFRLIVGDVADLFLRIVFSSVRLLVKRDGKDRGEFEEERLEDGGYGIHVCLTEDTNVDLSEEHILREVGDFLAVARGNDVDLSELVESEIISIRLFHRDELGQILLGQGSEEESVLDFVVPIEGTEEGFEFGVGQGLETAAFFYDFFRPVVHLLASSAYQPFHVFVVVVFVKSAWRTGESEVWRCLIAIDDECGIVVEGCRFDDLRRQSLCPGYDMTVLARTYDFRPSDHTGADIDFVQHFFGEETQTKERIRGDVSRNASEDGFVTIWLLVVCEELFEHRKLFRS